MARLARRSSLYASWSGVAPLVSGNRNTMAKRSANQQRTARLTDTDAIA